MGNRISKVYTRTGDDGTTAMADGSRQPKHSPVMQAIGDVDELNAVIGLLRAEDLPDSIDIQLKLIQNDLFSMGGELSMPEFQLIDDGYIARLENDLDVMNEDLTPLKDFILPAGNRKVAVCHLARTVCRRAERSLVEYQQEFSVRDKLLSYINRLSDYLFVLARYLARQSGCEEDYWDSTSHDI